MQYRIALILLFATTLSFGQSKPVTMFFPGEWEGAMDSVDKRDDHFGIYLSDAQSCRVTSFQVKDTLVDDPGIGLMRQLVSSSPLPYFIVSGIKNLKHNTIIKGRALDYSDRLILPDKAITYSLGNKKYTILTTGTYVTLKGEDFPSVTGYKIILRMVEGQKKAEQVLYDVDLLHAWPGTGFEGGFAVRWVGDLDGDNEIDIIHSASNDYRTWTVHLLLSSTKKDKLVGEACRYSFGAPN